MEQENNKNQTETEHLFYSNNYLMIKISNRNPNNPGGQHTNGPMDFWFKEVGAEQWHKSFCSNEVYARDLLKILSSDISHNSLMAILFAGGRF